MAAAGPGVALQPAVPAELVGIARLCAGTVRYIDEGMLKYIHMEGLHFLIRGAERQMDALLCLNYPNDSYPTKLYLPANLGLGLNWNESPYLFGRPWFSWSWKGVNRGQSPIAILAGHLEAFR
jgi:hypothetical protein